MIRLCGSCGQKNRVRPAHAASDARCGACKQPLPPVAVPIEADPDTFDEVVEHAPVPVLVDFWAAWCGPCQMAAPEVDQVAARLAGRAIVLKVDTETFPELAARYGVRGIPNFLVLKGGQPVFQHAGFSREEQMVGWLVNAGA